MNRAYERALDKTMRCKRCRRRLRRGATDWRSWNIDYKQGHADGLICPECQSSGEYAEAEMNEAITDYSTMQQDVFGRWRVGLKKETA